MPEEGEVRSQEASSVRFRPFLLLAFVAAALLWAAFVAAAPAGSKEPIVVGISGPITGPSKSLGIEIYRGTVAYFNYVNSRGGVFGRKLVLKLLDDGYNSTRAIRNTIRFIEQDKVFGLISYTGTEPVTRVLPLLKIYEKTNTFLFFPSTGADSPRKPPYDGFVLNYRATYSNEAEAIVEEFVRNGISRIAVFYQADAYGRSGWFGINRALAAHNLQILAEITHRKGLKFSSDMSGPIRYLRSFNPQAIISVGAYEPTAAFIRDARTSGWDIPIARLSVGCDAFVKLVNEADKTTPVEVSKNIINTQIFPSYRQKTIPAIREYLEIFEKYSQLPPAEMMKEEYKPLAFNYTSLEGFVNAKIFVEILNKLGPGLEKAKIRDAVAGMRAINVGLDQPVSFSGPKRVYFTTLKEGALVPLEDFSRWKK